MQDNVVNNEYKCSCVILNFNDADTTKSLVEKIRDYGSLDEVVVVDNCSTDDSYEQLMSLADDKVKVLRTESNGGYGAGNNFGIRYSFEELGCRYSLIANPDTMFSDNVVHKMLACLDRDKNNAAAAPVQLDINGKKIKTPAWRIPTINGYIFANTVIDKLFKFLNYPEGTFDGKTECVVDCIPGAMLMVDNDCFLKVGGYDEDMFLFCEETTIGYKFKSQGLRTILLADETYDHLHGVSINKSIKGEVKKKKLMQQNRLIFIKRYLGANAANVVLAKLVFAISNLKTRLKGLVKH